jgi:hypothetical protein
MFNTIHLGFMCLKSLRRELCGCGFRVVEIEGQSEEVVSRMWAVVQPCILDLGEKGWGPLYFGLRA